MSMAFWHHISDTVENLGGSLSSSSPSTTWRWRWRHYSPSERLWLFTIWQGVTFQKNLIFSETAVTTCVIFKYNQHDATLHNLFISVRCSTCYRPFLCPSSGAQNCIYSIGYFVKPLLLPATVMAGSSKGLTKYPMLYIQVWAPYDGRRNGL